MRLIPIFKHAELHVDFSEGEGGVAGGVHGELGWRSSPTDRPTPRASQSIDSCWQSSQFSAIPPPEWQ